MNSGLRLRPPRLQWRQVRLLYWRELRTAFRERAIVVNSVLIPVLLYPVLLWIALTGLLFVTGQTEGFVSRVAVRGLPAGHPRLQLSLDRDAQFQLLETPELIEGIERKIQRGQIDALVEFLPAQPEESALPGNFRVRLTYDEAKERSAEARRRLLNLLDGYCARWLRRAGREHGVDDQSWQAFTLSTRNVASKQQMGAFILGMTAPILFVVMVAVGCFYPAVDATAGERERNTWETLMSTASSPLSIITGKYLYVATMGGLAGLLNLVAILLTLKPLFAPLLAQAGQTIVARIPLASLPIAALAAVLLSGFIAAGMMIFACFARTFKEGQAMITPFYLLILLPVVFLQTPGLKFTLPLACIPVVNLTLMVREAIGGAFHWAQIGVTLAVSLGLIALCLRLAAFILQFEDVLLGSYKGSLLKFLQERMLKR